MSAFRDMVKADRDNVFLNLDEFADEHDVDGNVIMVSLQDEQIESGSMGQGLADLGLSDATLAMYAKTEDLKGRKMAGETLYIDDVGYTVVTWLEEMGITTVILRLPESW